CTATPLALNACTPGPYDGATALLPHVSRARQRAARIGDGRGGRPLAAANRPSHLLPNALKLCGAKPSGRPHWQPRTRERAFRARMRQPSHRREHEMDRPLMPKATAVWLVENTSLTFEQIAEFCNLHPLEVKG